MTTPSIRLAAVLAVALTGCYAQLEESSLVISQPLGVTVPGAAAAGDVTLPTITFQVGDVTVDAGDTDSKLVLTTASLVMTAGTTDFSGVTGAALTVTPPAGSSLQPVTLTYDRTRDGPAGTTLTMKRGAEEVNLLPYLEAQSLLLDVSLSGAAPTTAWTADLDLDFHLLGKVTFP
jgi:hypothetical protein